MYPYLPPCPFTAVTGCVALGDGNTVWEKSLLMKSDPVPDGVHDLELQQPDEVSALVADFIERMRPAKEGVVEVGRL